MFKITAHIASSEYLTESVLIVFNGLENIHHMWMIRYVNLYEFDFVGLTEASGAFFQMMNTEFADRKQKIMAPRENVNCGKYGFDVNDSKTRLALLPFIEKDIVVYHEAKHIFNQRLGLHKNIYLKQ